MTLHAAHTHLAAQIDAAFEELRVAFVDPSAPASLREAIGALAQRHGADDQLVGILDEAIAGTASSARATTHGHRNFCGVSGFPEASNPKW